MMSWQRARKSGLLALILLLMGLVWHVRAQTNGQNSWTPPQNLSQSGTAVSPAMVKDRADNLHVFWQDRFVGFLYTQYTNGVWQPSVPVPLPFSDPPFSLATATDPFGGGYQPTLLAAAADLYAFWVDEDEQLSFSRTPLPTAAGAMDWSPILALADKVIALDTAVDSFGRLHLTYVRRGLPNDSPAGVYYRFSDDAGATWSEPTSIFQSDYLRAIASAHVQIAISATNQLYIVWDNPLVEMVYLAHSPNRGVSWQEAQLIDQRRPDDALESPGPGNILMVTQGSELHLVWQAGHTPRTCSIYHQVSRNSGESWTEPIAVLDTNSPDCPNSLQLVWGENDLLFLLTELFLTALDRTQLFLQAWDGAAWSKPELQEAIFDFEDPATYRAVAFSCLQPVVTADNHLLLIACGSKQRIDDVWLLERPLGSREEWSARFAPPTTWSTLAEIDKNIAMQNSLAIFTPADGQYHAFWTAREGETTPQTIQYSLFNGLEWARPLPIIESPQGDIQQAAFALDNQRQRFLATWVDAESRSLYFSQVQVGAAAIAINWQTPARVHTIQESSEWPQIVVGDNGIIYLMFSIPVNEQRGIYLVKSTNGGTSWLEPVRVLDGTTVGWELVGRPRLALGSNGVIHLTALRHKSLLSMGDTELVYLYSTDEGETWSEPVEPTDSEVVWHDVAAVAPQLVHQVWVRFSNSESIIWHSHSGDNGQNWSQPLPVANFAGESGAPALIKDLAGRLHLLYLADATLRHWVWDGLRWAEDEHLDVSHIVPGGALSLATAANSAKLHVVFNGILAEPRVETQTGSNPAVATLAASQIDVNARFGLLYTVQELALPEALPTPLPTWTPMPADDGPETAVASPTPTPFPTPSLAELTNASTPSFPFNNPIGAIVFSVGLVALIVLAIFVISLLRAKQNRF